MKHILTSRSRNIGVALLIIAIGVGVAVASRQDSEASIIDSLTIEPSFHTSTLKLSGRITAANESSIGFPVAGTLQDISVQVGDTVQRGQLLGRLDTTVLEAERQEIEADIAIQEAILDELLAGAKPEEIALEEENLTLAELAYSHVQNTIPNEIYEAYTVADNAILNTVDEFIANARSNNPSLRFIVSRNQSLKESVEQNRIAIERTMEDWQNLLRSNPSGLSAAIQHLTAVRDFMNLAALTVNSGDTSATVSDALLRTWKTNTASQRSAVITALLQLESLEQRVETAAREVSRAQSRLALTDSGTTPSRITTQRETIARAQARLVTLEARLSERTLRAPLSGVVAEQLRERGEMVSPGESVVTIISQDQPLVILEAPELTLPNVQLGDRAEISLLALDPHPPISGTVTSISPQAKTSNGLVPYYEVEVTLKEVPAGIAPGLIADAVLTTAEFPDSIAIPKQYLVSHSGETEAGQVWLRTSAGAQQQTVTLGESLSDQRIIVTDGLKAGDIILRLDSAL